jgi:DNA-binding transcriptional LysR family regulator
MDRLDSLRVFVRIVELGSFTRAAADLDLPRATVTHAVQQLEARLDAHLLQRTTRRVRATRDGEAFYANCRRLLADVDEMEAQFRSDTLAPRGRLRVDLPASLARLVIVPALPRFCAEYPEIQLDLGAGDRFVDLVGEGVDCVLRVGELEDSSLIGRRVAKLAQVTCASADYVRRHGLPRSIADLSDGHRAVVWRSPTTQRSSPLEFLHNGRRREVDLDGPLACSNADAYLAGARAGLGIVQVPRYHLAAELKSGRMLELLPQFAPPALPVTVLYPRQRHMPSRLRVFVDWLAQLMAESR